MQNNFGRRQTTTSVCHRLKTYQIWKIIRYPALEISRISGIKNQSDNRYPAKYETGQNLILMCIILTSFFVIQAEQQIGAVVVVNKNKKVTLENILAWCNDNIGSNSVPSGTNISPYFNRLHVSVIFNVTLEKTLIFLKNYKYREGGF